MKLLKGIYYEWRINFEHSFITHLLTSIDTNLFVTLCSINSRHCKIIIKNMQCLLWTKVLSSHFWKKPISLPTKLLLMTVMIDMTPAKHMSKILKISKHFCKNVWQLYKQEYYFMFFCFLKIHLFKLSQQNTGMVFSLWKVWMCRCWR